MNGETTDQPPTLIYRIEIEGHLDCSWAEWFDGMTIEQQSNGHSVLCGNVTDQSALFGHLKKIHNMGLMIISVQRVGFTS
jgi:hypothetical protein